VSLVKLKDLWLDDTKVTDVGVTNFSKKLPKCLIYGSGSDEQGRLSSQVKALPSGSVEP
jgi:hypothetical protein